MGNSNKPIKVYKKRTKKIRKDKRGTIPYKKRKYTKRKSTNKSNNKTSKKGGAGIKSQYDTINSLKSEIANKLNLTEIEIKKLTEKFKQLDKELSNIYKTMKQSESRTKKIREIDRKMRTVGENLIEEKNKQARLEDKMMNLEKKDKNYNKRSSEAVAALALNPRKNKNTKNYFTPMVKL